MEFNDLLAKAGYDPSFVIALRHRPWEQRLNRVLPWIAAERPELFNTYQSTQRGHLESAMAKLAGCGYIASFIRRRSGSAIFVGLYSIASYRPISRTEFRRLPASVELLTLGMAETARDERPTMLCFDLSPTDFYVHWKGRLVVTWPGLERSWWRRAHKNTFEVISVLEESEFDAAMPSWDELELTWEELAIIPSTWRERISQWRGIYFIFDSTDGMGYVGSACGEENILQRWLNYSATGDGGNRLLRGRDSKHFRFSILQRVSPDADAHDVVRLENSWKQRLHTRAPTVLNDN